MPELPEVQTVVDTLVPVIVGKKIEGVQIKQNEIIENRVDGSFVELLTGTRIEEVRRRGKYIIISLDNGLYLVGHLRMTGYFLYTKEGEEESRYDCITIRFAQGEELRIGSKRKFSRLYLVKDLEDAGSLTKLGPEPLSDDFILGAFKEGLKKRKGNIKSLLLNQEFLAGLGNIYVDEALFIARVHPLRRANSLDDQEMKRLYHAIRQVLAEGLEHRGTTKWDYVDASGQSGSYQNKLRVYDRKGQECIECRERLERIKVGGRGTTFCPECQKQEE